MVKFSIIVPVFNASKTIERCIKSILDQTYSFYEVILINDGSSDNSQNIIDDYVKKDKRFRSIKKENEGVSETRNLGLKEAEGDYIIFVDDDDTINSELLENINREIDDFGNLDLIRFQIRKAINDDYVFNETEIFSSLSGEEAFLKLILDDLFVTPVSYAYRREYWLKNNFSYTKGRVHEDFGLTPLVVVKASKVSAISYIGYNYIIRENSIMTNNSLEKIKAKNNDCLFFYDDLLSKIKEIKISDNGKKVFRSYISNALLNRMKIMDGEILKEYIVELKRRSVYKNMLDDTFLRKVKKSLFKYAPYLYAKFYLKRGNNSEEK